MSVWDWLVVGIPLFTVLAIGVITQRYVNSVSDFLSAGRRAGRYLIGVATGEAMLGLITVINYCEIYYKSGWSFFFWQNLTYAAVWLMAITGFVNYRYRETRVLTMAELFERRYSRNFRIFAGILTFAAGIVNYAIFPAVGARFLIYYCQLPDYLNIGGIQLPMFQTLMALCLLFALIIVLKGGQLTTMVTDCLQGIFSYFVFTILLLAVIWCFSGVELKEALLNRPPGESLLNPFDTSKTTDFNVLFVLLAVFTAIYTRMAWQGTQGYNCAGASPHEQKMGGLISSWRYSFTPMMTIILAIGAYTFLNHADFAPQAAAVTDELATRIVDANPAVQNTLRTQMLVPVALRSFLPAGLVGGFAAVMIFMMISTDTTYLHSWGSIFVQDVILPIHGKPLQLKTQMLLLRCSIVGVALFAWVFSSFFGQVDYIIMFFSITGTIYLGGAGSVIIGGLYWKRGSTAGAYTAMLIGAVTGIGGFLLQHFWSRGLFQFLSDHYPEVLRYIADAVNWANNHIVIAHWELTPERFPLTGMEISVMGMILAILGYIAVSLCSHQGAFDLPKLLNRTDGKCSGLSWRANGKFNFKALLGISDEYTRGDRIVAYTAAGWTLYNLLLFGIIVVCNLFVKPWSNEFWYTFFRWYTIPVALAVGVITAIWFSLGGIRDLTRLFRALKAPHEESESDSGFVDTSASPHKPLNN